VCWLFLSRSRIIAGGKLPLVDDLVPTGGCVLLRRTMETFSAQPGKPANECIKMAAEAGAVMCIVAHGYGYVPPKDLGGGRRALHYLARSRRRQARR
jgi:hypothetical protein